MYHNSLRELGRTGTLVVDDVNGRLEPRAERLGLPLRRVRADRVLELTSRRGPEELPNDLRELGRSVDRLRSGDRRRPLLEHAVRRHRHPSPGSDADGRSAEDDCRVHPGHQPSRAWREQRHRHHAVPVEPSARPIALRDLPRLPRGALSQRRADKRHPVVAGISRALAGRRPGGVAAALVPALAANDSASRLDLDDDQMRRRDRRRSWRRSSAWSSRSERIEAEETEEEVWRLLRDWDRRAKMRTRRRNDVASTTAEESDDEALLKRFGQTRRRMARRRLDAIGRAERRRPST